ncbi:hypothetical protein MHF_0621 [Mycoplasma haemofelis Ohio2]|uniref:Uncharacterized protein n=1 Tax=Mycoplasma haemofelis (strain Ohio2) TaxID=859194 RepID=F6FI45_MYCHI|nr:hypothetical protein MHF_0621 [Mycoplasma haemofelis Ohio2]
MSLPAKLGAATLATGGTATAGYYAASYLSSQEDKSYRSKFLPAFLLDSSSKDDAYWNKRLASLKQDAGASGDLASLKNKEVNDLKKWCKDSLSKPFEEGKLFKDIDTYCTFKVLDKLGSNAISSETADADSKWQNAFTALGNITENIDTELDGVKKTTNSGNDNATNKAVKGWCTKMYSKTYLGESDKLFGIAKKVCVSSGGT